MILGSTYSAEYLHSLHSKYSNKIDINILERTVFAFGLLEALAKSNLKFIFKGGTSLILLCGIPKRLSTDIDIIVSPDIQVDEYLNKICNYLEDSIPQGVFGEPVHRKPETAEWSV